MILRVSLQVIEHIPQGRPLGYGVAQQKLIDSCHFACLFLLQRDRDHPHLQASRNDFWLQDVNCEVFFSGIHGMLWIYESKWWAILTSWFAVSRLTSLVLGKTKATWRIWAPFDCELHFSQWIWIAGLPARSSKFAINHFAHVSYDQTYWRPVTKVAQSKSSLIAKLYYSLLMLMLAMILILEFAALLSYSSCCNSYKSRAAATSCI